VGIPDFLFDVPEPIVLSGGIDRILQSMKDSGMNTSDIFFAGHSIGGMMLQDYLSDNKHAGIGQILLGSFLFRKYRNVTYPVPTFTIGGELDGLCRVTRIMEAYYHHILHASDHLSAIKNFPVVVVEGMTHMQFASGDPPPFVRARDLKPEISGNDAHKTVAYLLTAFMSVHTDASNSTAVLALSTAIQRTDQFLKPIVVAYEREGFYNFKPPCFENPPSPACTVGCPWTEQAMQIMGGLEEAHLNDTDAIHPVTEIFPAIHHPHILNNCNADVPSCTLNTVSVTQNIYDEMDKLDSGFISTSANEIRAKLKSRQAVLEAVGYQNVNFNTSDGPSICKDINQEVYKWALQNAGSHTTKRFQMVGVGMVMGEDKGSYIFPHWMLVPLSYNKGKNETGGEIIEVVAAMMRTPVDYFIKPFAAMHFCKLLSPARVTEWMYVDGLRTYYGIKD
jgi:hypothetical protein